MDTKSRDDNFVADTGYNTATRDTSGYNLYPGYMYQVQTRHYDVIAAPPGHKAVTLGCVQVARSGETATYRDVRERTL